MKFRCILSLCDYTGNWSRPYEDSGYSVIRVDLKNGQDLRLLRKIDRPIHGILAAPPCTHFSRAGAWKWKEKGDTALLEGLSVVDACLRAVAIYRPTWWCLENPIGRLQEFLGPPSFRFHPHQFGDPWTKRTWLWGEFTPPCPLICEDARHPVPNSLIEIDITTRLGRTKRSATPEGFARAFFDANP